MVVVSLLLLAVVMCVTVLSSLSDVETMTIPNWHSLAIIGLFVPAWAFGYDHFSPIWQHLTAMVLMFGISYWMFHYGVMGGGDSKFATALSLWLGLKGLLPFMLYMAVAGGAVGAASIYLKKKKPFKNTKQGSWVQVVQEGGNAVPYGVAITIGFWGAIFHTSLLLTLS